MKSIPVRLPDGTIHTYDNVPDDVTQEQAQARANQEFGSRSISPNSENAAAMTHTASADVSPKVSSTPQARWFDPKTGTIGGNVNPLIRALMGVGAGAERSLASIGEFTGLISPEKYQDIKESNEPFTTGVAGGTGGFVGETAISSLAGGPVSRLTKSLGPTMRAAVEGGLTSYLTAEPDERKTEGAFGTLAAATAPNIGKVTRAATHGIDVSPAARKLTAKGVQLTPGQSAPDSSWAMVEESMMRVPGIGPRISKARQRGWQETQALIGQEASPPGFTPPDRANATDMYNDLSDAYDQAYGQFKGYPLQPVLMRVQGGNVPLSKAMAVSPQAAADPKSRRYVQTYIDNELGRIKGRQLTSEDLLEVRSNIRKKAREMIANDNFPDAKTLFDNADKKATEILESQLPPDAMKALRQVDAKYGNFKVLEDAISRQTTIPEGFSPRNFATAVKQSAATKGQYASGGGKMRDLSDTASEVFAPRVPMTGAQTPSQMVGYMAALPALAVYPKDKASKLSNLLSSKFSKALTGQLDTQRQVQDYERMVRRKLSARERDELVRFLRLGGANYAAEEQPYFATTNQQ